MSALGLEFRASALGDSVICHLLALCLRTCGSRLTEMVNARCQELYDSKGPCIQIVDTLALK